MYNTIRLISNGYDVSDVILIRYDPKKDVFLQTSSLFFQGDAGYDQKEFCCHFGVSIKMLSDVAGVGDGLSLATYLHLRYGSIARRVYHGCRLPVLNFATSGRTFRKRGILRTASAAGEATASRAVWQPAVFRDGDRIFIPGATWDFSGYNEALRRARTQAPLGIYQFIHDLIPIVTPEHVGPGVPARFDRWLAETGATSDVHIVNSEATARDLAQYFDDPKSPSRTIRVVRLAHEFVLPAPLPPESRPLRRFNVRRLALPDHATTRVLSNTVEPYALVVGTIESRKNILRLLRIWRRIYLDVGPSTPALVLAGKFGVFSDDVRQFLDRTGGLEGKVRFIDRPDDGEVAFLYANCLFSVCISLYEGWGLPVGESFWFGRPVLASSTSSLPEVGSDMADYVEPTDDAGIEAALRRLMFDADYRDGKAAAIARDRLRSWNDVSTDLARILLEGSIEVN